LLRPGGPAVGEDIGILFPMNLAIPSSFFIVALGLNLAFSDPAPVDSTAAARARLDSLRNSLEKTIHTPQQQKAWEQCAERKQEIMLKGRKARNFHRVDSLLHQSKIDKIPPTDPKIQKLMGDKFIMLQKMEERYRVSPEGKRCLALEENRKRRLDSAVAAHTPK
jgi:hypothetical protein